MGESTKVKLVDIPIEDYYKNFIITKNGGHIWAAYKILSKNPPLNEIGYFEAHNNAGHHFLDHIEYEYHFIDVPKKFDLNHQIEQISNHYIKGDLEEVGKAYLQRAAEILEEETSGVSYDTYLLVDLCHVMPPSNPWQFMAIRETFASKFMNLLGYSSTQDVLDEGIIVKEAELFEHFNNYEGVLRLNEAEIEQLYYYMFHRGDDFFPTGSINPLKMTEGIVTNHKGYLTIEHMNEVIYIATLTMIKTPPTVFGSSWIQKVRDSLSFPIETHIRVRFDTKERDKKLVHKMRKRLNNQENDRSEDVLNEAILDEDEVILFGSERLKGLSRDLIDGERHLPKIDFHITVSADSLEALNRRIEQLEYAFDDTKFELYRPIVDQLTYFNQSLPASKFAFRVYEQQVSSGFIADMGLNLERKLGNNIGFPIGRLINRTKHLRDVTQAINSSSKVVWFYLGLAKRAIQGAKITNGNTVIYGPPGMGKSFLVKLIFIWSAIFGQKILYFDPKNEMRIFVAKAIEKFKGLPMFTSILKHIHFITIDKDEAHRGLLDPLLFLDGDEAVETARMIIGRLLEINKSPEKEAAKKLIINEVIDQVIEQSKRPNLSLVIDEITKRDSEMGGLLHTLNKGLAKVLIGNETSEAIKFTSMINVLGLQGAQPASQEIKDAGAETEEQRVSTIIIEVVMKLTNVFSTNKDENAMIILDEMKTIENSPQGAFLINNSLRTGRANGTDVVLITQAQVDVDDDENEQLISYKFGFKPNSEKAIRDMCRYFEIEANESNLALIQNMQFGMVLFQDHMKRTGVVAIDAMFSEWQEMFSTTKHDDEQTEYALEAEKVG